MVPEVFPIQPPKDDLVISNTNKRRISKFQEFLDQNPAKIAKVTRLGRGKLPSLFRWV